LLLNSQEHALRAVLHSITCTPKVHMTLTLNNFTQLENFGHSLRAPSYRYKPTCAEDIYEVFRLAKKHELTVTARGAGRSYNDAALNGGGIMLDLSAMNQILDWDSATGLVRCEPGVTLEQLWQCVEPAGWWPPVVSGTMKTTLGGCLSANIHGKNNFKLGTIGEHVVEFTVLLPTSAEEQECRPVLQHDQWSGDAWHFHFDHIADEAHRIRAVGSRCLAGA